MIVRIFDAVTIKFVSVYLCELIIVRVSTYKTKFDSIFKTSGIVFHLFST